MGKRRNSKKRAIDKPLGRRDIISASGPCTLNSCKGDAVACKPLANSTHTCICTHDSQPPFADGTCPRKVVASGNSASDVDESSNRIPVQPIASHENHIPYTSTSKAPFTLAENKSTIFPSEYNIQTYVIPVAASLVGCLILVILVFCIWRKFKKGNQEASPISLKHSFLVPERYAPNPQYSACSATGVPILKKETLSFLKEVGEGCFGKVFKGELLCEDDQIKIVAIKVLKDSANKEAEEDFLREVEIMSAFRHPNILSLLGVVPKDDSINPMMVFEFMPHGDLAKLLRSQKCSELEKDLPQLTKTDLLAVALQIGLGMKYLASQRFVHRDLACRNCLVAEGPVVKIADFGMSRDVYTCDYYKIGGSRLLPVRWMSPESVVYGRFTLESDIWSYGVVLWEIFSFGKQPYYGHSNEEVVKLILDGIMLIPPEDCPSYICELMKNCWKTEPRHRITFPSICEKLEEAFENQRKPTLFNENETKKMKIGSNKSLPRPPPLPAFTQIDLLDGQGYLLPKEVKDPATYLETRCD
ncbi:BDNF/NT-3 growth factors receptor-like isoform X2 [Diabrotica undecimpunctata]|uniref:BDNF/NT-3 growth factors receptor-like isoform X2 n=1 Tax=Diabrotica undecimpunctata TaxID=50387 RepID=UPI003B63888D